MLYCNRKYTYEHNFLILAYQKVNEKSIKKHYFYTHNDELNMNVKISSYKSLRAGMCIIYRYAYLI